MELLPIKLLNLKPRKTKLTSKRRKKKKIKIIMKKAKKRLMRQLRKITVLRLTIVQRQITALSRAKPWAILRNRLLKMMLKTI